MRRDEVLVVFIPLCFRQVPYLYRFLLALIRCHVSGRQQDAKCLSDFDPSGPKSSHFVRGVDALCLSLRNECISQRQELSSGTIMTAVKKRLAKLAAHFIPYSSSPHVADASTLTIDGKTAGTSNWYNFHTLSPAFFLPRAAEIEPEAPAIYHRTANNKILRRTYQEFADRARGFAYYVKKKGYKKVGILCTNTPAFLEAIFGIGGGGAVNVAINYRLKADDIGYIFDHSDSEAIVVDAEYVHLLDDFRKTHPNVPLIIDTDTDATEGELSGPFDQAVLEGLNYDHELGNHGWAGLEAQAPDELAVNALAYTSGTTARPKGVEYTHRGCYMGTVGNVIESGLSFHGTDRCKYLWTLPMFHAAGWTYPWAV